MNDDDRLWASQLDELISVWNEHWAAPLKFRVFTHKSDAKDSLRRYQRILNANRHWLNAGPSTPMESLHRECVTQLLLAGGWLAEQTDPDDALALLGGPAIRTMGFWAFSRPDLRNLNALYCRSTGQPLDLPDRLKEERQRKAKAIAAHQARWDEVVRQMVMALDSGEIETISDAVDDALDEIRGAIEAVRKR